MEAVAGRMRTATEMLGWDQDEGRGIISEGLDALKNLADLMDEEAKAEGYDKICEVRATGVDIVGRDDLIEQIIGGFMGLDKLIASPDR